ncbi:MAG: hypothetical protein ACR2GC_04395 [Methyloceanibacter sp.]|uniref:hypothetical protein n=1 Tax=Methyloceanibacter sp. TaxID=1965321 RepID=UPI003D9ACED0
MAQEQAKSPPEKATPGAKDETKGPIEAIMRETERKSDETSTLDRGLDPKQSTLAERLKAEQRKREEPRREEPKPEEARPAEFEAPQAAPAPRQFIKTRRPAGPPPQRRLAPPANDDVPSIGALIFALQQRPSRTPFLMALIASAVWSVIGGFFAVGLISQEAGLAGLFSSTQGLTAAIAILVPIAIFWFLALLVWRAQELRLMASAMTEVAVRLAEPDRLAEQSVASVGQTIRRQVAAMNDAISRAIGRASELEAMVHSEVAALERSYGENELRVRNLISELATEREALTNNSQRVSETLKGVGTQIARDIAIASTNIDKKLAERGTQLTELLVVRSSEAADQVHKAQTRVAEVVPGLFERLSKEQGLLTQVIEGATHNLAALESVVAQRTTALDKTMTERTEALQGSLAERIKGLENSVAQGAIVLDKTLKDRTDTFINLVSQGAVTLDKTLTDRTEAFSHLVAQGTVSLDKTLKDGTEVFTNLVSQGVIIVDKTLQERTDALAASIGQGADALDKTLKERTDNFVASVDQSTEAMDKALKDRTEGFTNLVSQGAIVLEKTLQERTNALATAIGDSAASLNSTLAEHANTLNDSADQRATAIDKLLQDRTAQLISSVNQGAISLDKTLAERAESFTNSLFQRVQALEAAISQQTASLDQTMTERAHAVIVALAERLQAIDSTFSQRTIDTDRMLGEHARATEQAFGQQTAVLNQVLANNSAMMKQTADQVGAQSKEAVSVLTSQTQNLREVSRALLDQIHGLTQRFESQGQAILTAAKALDSSNAKIDSILENRHQSILALLQTVNTKAQDLDSTMRNYAGMIENALSQAENRAKQVSTTLARDTAGGAQQALAQIERLREEAQAHTARAVGDLKGSFETVITQIGRQLEQMRGQFDNTSRGMREVAQRTASDLDSLRQDMQKRMDALPEHTAQATAAIRKALTEQLREIEAITPVLTRAAPQGNGAELHRQPPAPPPPPQAYAPPRSEPTRPSGEFGSSSMPKFDARGHQVSGLGQDRGDLDQITGSLAEQLAGATGGPGQSFATHPVSTVSTSSGQLRLDELARAIDYPTAANVWQRLRAGERGVLGRHIYGLDGQTAFDEIAVSYEREGDFRVTVDRYIGDFERMLGEAEQSDPGGSMLNSYLTSESGRVYLLLAHASGRLR